jgi:hypothetical protein
MQTGDVHHQKPLVQDLASANLRLKRDRIANLRRLINLTLIYLGKERVRYVENIFKQLKDE